MNRYVNIFLAAVLCSTCAFAQSTNFIFIGDGTNDLLFTNVYFEGIGDYPTNFAANIENVASLTIAGTTNTAVIPTNQTEAITFTGGDGGNITTTNEIILDPLVYNGGSGLRLIDAASAAITNSSFLGGEGGVISSGADTNQHMEVNGGHGIELNGDYDLNLGEDVVAVGGDGGSINSVDGTAEAFGGDGVSAFFYYLQPDIGEANVANITVSGGTYQGGDGGTAVYEDNNGDLRVWDDAFFDNQDGARGGNGLRVGSVYDWFFAERSGTVEINGGSFEGGDGGTAQNNGNGAVRAGGGHGLLANNTEIMINGGTFTGGAGGTENGSQAADGFGVRTRDSNVTVTDGSIGVGGRGLYFESQYLANTADISGGTFGDSYFVTLFDDFVAGTNRIGTINISAGTFSNVTFFSDAINNATLTGGTFGDLAFDGDNINNISLAPAVTTSGNVTQTGGGTVNVSLWNDSHFNNTTISNGTINFNNTNQVFNLGGTFELQTVTAAANFNNGLTVQTGGTLTVGPGAVSTTGDLTVQSGGTLTVGPGTVSTTGDLTVQGGGLLDAGSGTVSTDDLTVQSGGALDTGLGTVTGSDMLFSTGSQGITGYDGTNGGILNATGNFTIESGAQWTIDVGTNALVSGTVVDIATASGTLSNGITADDIAFVGAGFVQTWLDLFGLENTVGVLSASYDQRAIDVALGLDGNTSTEYAKAVNEFSALVAPGTDAFDLIAALSGAEEAGVLLTNSYIRTAEIASSLIGLQAVFADQVQHRIRSKMQYDEVGFPASPSPAGAAGWDAMRNFSDRLESGSWDAVRNFSDRLESRINTDGMRNLSDRLESDINTDGLRNFSDRMEDAFGADEVKGLVDAVTPDIEVDSVGLPLEWQTWGVGYGTHIDQDTTSEFAGYDATLGGGILGVDKRINNMLLGVGGGYARTVLQGYESKDARADTVHALAYFSAHGDHVYLDASASYALNAVDTEYDVLGYTGDFNAQTIGLSIGGGFAFSLMDAVVLTPEASILNTLYLREAYTESSTIGGMPDLEWDDYDQWSHLAKVGATLSTVQKIDLADLEFNCRPEIRAHWLHDFNAEMDDETYMMLGGSQTVGASLMAREEDLVKVGAGVRLSKWATDTTEFGLDVDGTFGDDYTAYIVSGRIIHRF